MPPRIYAFGEEEEWRKLKTEAAATNNPW